MTITNRMFHRLSILFDQQISRESESRMVLFFKSFNGVSSVFCSSGVCVTRPLHRFLHEAVQVALRLPPELRLGVFAKQPEMLEEAVLAEAAAYVAEQLRFETRQAPEALSVSGVTVRGGSARGHWTRMLTAKLLRR